MKRLWGPLRALDWLFGTYHLPESAWPERHGTVKPVPSTFLGQLVHPVAIRPL